MIRDHIMNNLNIKEIFSYVAQISIIDIQSKCMCGPSCPTFSLRERWCSSAG